MFHSRFRKRALRVVVSIEALPNVVVMPTRSISGCRMRKSSAIASSTPGSVSNLTLCIFISLFLAFYRAELWQSAWQNASNFYQPVKISRNSSGDGHGDLPARHFLDDQHRLL